MSNGVILYVVWKIIWVFVNCYEIFVWSERIVWKIRYWVVDGGYIVVYEFIYNGNGGSLWVW